MAQPKSAFSNLLQVMQSIHGSSKIYFSSFCCLDMTDERRNCLRNCTKNNLVVGNKSYRCSCLRQSLRVSSSQLHWCGAANPLACCLLDLLLSTLNFLAGEEFAALDLRFFELLRPPFTSSFGLKDKMRRNKDCLLPRREFDVNQFSNLMSLMPSPFSNAYQEISLF